MTVSRGRENPPTTRCYVWPCIAIAVEDYGKEFCMSVIFVAHAFDALDEHERGMLGRRYEGSSLVELFEFYLQLRGHA